MNAPIIPETLVNVFTSGAQYLPSISILSDGSYVVVWRSAGQDGSGLGIVGQRFTAQGERIGAEFIVNETREGDQDQAEVVGLASGGFVVVWRSFVDGLRQISGQVFDAAGAPVGGEFKINDTGTWDEVDPDVLALPGGGFAVAWTHTYAEDIHLRRFDDAGAAQGASVVVNTHDGNQSQDKRYVSMAVIEPDAGPNSLAGGGFVVVWAAYNQSGGNWNIYAQRHDPAGVAIGAETLINAGDAGQYTPRVVGLSDGRWAVVWTDTTGDDGSGYGVYARVFEGDGTAVTGDVQVNVQTSSHQQQPDIIATQDGGFFITWIAETSGGSGDGSSYGIFGRRFDASGTATTGEIAINQNVSGQQDVPRVAELADGTLALVWSSVTSGSSGDGDDRAISMILIGDPMTFVVASARPELDAVSAVRSVDESDFDSGAIRLDADGAAALSDSDSADFDGGRLIVQRISASVLEDDFEAQDADGQDLLGLDQSGPVTVAGGVVSVDGVAVGTVASDGAGGAPLIIDLNASATAARVEVLVENLTYRNLSDDPREEALFQIQVEDGDGAASDPVTVRVEISASVDGPDGAFGERQVNNYTTNAQDDPAIARLADGGWVITWTSHDQDGSQDGVYARAYGPDGAPRGAEFRVNDATAGYQDMPEVAGLSDGGFVIVWREGLGTAIRMARYDATGTRTVADFQVETSTNNTQTQPTVTALSNGGWVVGWATNATDAGGGDGDSYAVATQVFNAAGAPVGGETVINTQTVGNQSQPDIAALDNGRFIVVWADNDPAGDGSASSVKARMVAANGVPEGAGDMLLNVNTLSTQNFPAVASHPDGSYVVAWTSYDIDGSGAGVSVRRFDAAGAPLGDEIRVNDLTSGDQLEVDIATLPGGGFVVSWRASGLSSLGDSSSEGVSAQVFDADGTRVDGQFLVNEQTSSTQFQGRILRLSDESMVAVWTSQTSGEAGDGSGYGIFMRVIGEAPGVGGSFYW